jgi:hypothetical protein
MKINKLLIIGCGGIGSFFITSLSSVIKKDIQGLNQINVFGIDIADNDIIEEKNILCQNFEPENIGLNKAKVLSDITGYKAITEPIERIEQLEDYDLIVLAVDNNEVRQVVYNSGIKFLDLRASGKTFMAYLTEKEDTEYLTLTVDTGAKGGCQREEDLEDRHIQFGNKIVSEIGIQILADYLRGEIETKKIIFTL